MVNPSERKRWNTDNISGYVFISPWLVGFFAFSIFPIVASLYLAFTKYDILSPPQWVGFDNFKTMFNEDARYWKSVNTTLIFVFAAIPLRLCFALIVAMVLNMKLRFVGFFRTTYYLPTLIGGSVAVAVMWKQLFGTNGAFNSFLEMAFGITEKVSWVTHPSTALLSIIVLSVWQFGSSMLIFLAGLKQIPVGLYEAAHIDGANAWHRFKSITIPMLTPVILFNLIMGIINGFKVFTEGMIITGGGPFDKTLFYVLYLYEKSFRYYEMGYGSAMAWVLLVTIGIFTAVVFKTSKHWVYYESKGE